MFVIDKPTFNLSLTLMYMFVYKVVTSPVPSIEQDQIIKVNTGPIGLLHKTEYDICQNRVTPCLTSD